MRPICISCQRFFKPKKNGFYFTEGMERVSGALSGTQEPENWKPYKIWSGDLWQCPGCGSEIIVGTGANALAHHWEDDFKTMTKNLNADQFQVNDC